MANLKIGSQGDDVKQLQQALIDQGYDVGKTGADGIRVKMFPVSETYSSYSDKAVKAPIHDVTLERGKPAKIHSTTFKAAAK